MKPEAIICDLDNTLCVLERSPFDFNQLSKDKVNEPIKDLLSQYEGDVDIIILSGRNGEYKRATRRWLDTNDIPYNTLIMRPKNNRVQDDVLKLEMYKKYVEPDYNVLFVLEDRDRCVKAYRQIGLTVFQVNYGNF